MLHYLKDALPNSIKTALLKRQTPRYFKTVEAIDIAPVFVTGANRSGTSLVTALLSQHPELELVTDTPDQPPMDKSGHIGGYCESMHVWPHLFPSSPWEAILKSNFGPLWGHPRYISNFYTSTPATRTEALFLANRLQMFRKSQCSPLLKDVLNSLRIGFLCSAFPQARFVHILRNSQNYTTSCGHKWFPGQDRAKDIALHWLTFNAVAIHDLERFAPKKHAIISYENLLADKSDAEKALASACEALGLPQHNFDLSMIKKKLCFSLTGQSEKELFSLARQTGSYIADDRS